LSGGASIHGRKIAGENDMDSHAVNPILQEQLELNKIYISLFIHVYAVKILEGPKNP
jgi:hypothetical protein